ncbi:hypothetical protein AB0L05_17220 [Nonomuraea pusilla]|uniref:hypothetical protein n=1 Tax=Nonomuraea pusilla TaxID=46177 RepID=UPI003320E945
MADRTVSTRLRLNVSGWTAGTRAMRSDLSAVNRDLVKSSGFVEGFRKKLEDATKRLPKIEIDADSSAADIKMAQLRRELESLASKRIGVDIDAGEAMAEMQRLRAQLLSMEEGASFEVRAGIKQATEDMAAVEAEVRRLDGRDVTFKVDADTKDALGSLAKLQGSLMALGTATPPLASIGAGAGAMTAGFASAGAGVLAFKAAAIPVLERVKKAAEDADFSGLSPEEFHLAEQWQTFSVGYSKSQAKLLADQLGLIPGTVKSDVKTPGGKEALALINEYKRKLAELDGKTVTTNVVTNYYDRKQSISKQDRLKAASGALLRYAEGGIERYAAGGMRPRPPHIVSKPTVLYGEGSSGRGATEAYIPYESRYRRRAVDLLGQVADDFGLELFNRRGARTVEDMTMALDASSMQVAGGLTSAMAAMTGALGESGSLTSSLNQLGTVGSSLVDGWTSGSQLVGDSVLGMGQALGDTLVNMSDTMSTSIGDLTASVDHLGSTVAAAAEATRERDSVSKSAAGPKPKKPSSGKSSGRVKDSVSKSSSGPVRDSVSQSSSGRVRDSVSGSSSGRARDSVSQSVTGRARGALTGSAGQNRSRVGGLTSGSQPVSVSGMSSAGLMTGAPVNSSRVSRPQQAAPQRMSMDAFMEALGGDRVSRSASSSASRSAPLVHVDTLAVREKADLEGVAAYLYARIGAKGF